MEAEIVLQPAAWSAGIAALLSRGVHDSLVTVESVRGLVADGRAFLFEALAGVERVGAFVIQPNYCERGNELVLLCASAELPGYGAFTRVVMPWLEIRARQLKFDRIRVGVARRGMGRLLGGMGYARLTEVFIKAL